MSVIAKEAVTFWFQYDFKQWFGGGKEFDDLIRVQFADSIDFLHKTELKELSANHESSLGSVIVFDQFSRNMFRGLAKQWDYDAKAVQVAKEAIALGQDKLLSDLQRPWLYMPLMHSESRDDHVLAVKYFGGVQSDSFANYELKHKEVIDRFGRYPTRNAILGRVSTPEEEEYLKNGGEF